MIFGRPQVGLDAAVSAGGRDWTPALSARQRRRKFWEIFFYSRAPDSQYPTSVWVLSNEIESWNLLIFPLTFPSRFWPAALAVPSGRDSPASGALLLGDGEKRQR